MLKPFTRYTITIQAVNDVGKGPAAWLEVMTDQGGIEFLYENIPMQYTVIFISR